MAKESEYVFEGDERQDHRATITDGQPDDLFHARVLLVEDDYFLAFELRNELVKRGASVLGPFGSIDLAWDLAKSVKALDAAVVDVNLHGEFSFPVIDELIKRDIPVVFWTGHNTDVIPYRQRHIAHFLKPVPARKIADALGALIADRKSAVG